MKKTLPFDYNEVYRNEWFSADIIFQPKGTSVIDSVCACLALQQPKSAHLKVSCMGSLQLRKSAKTFPVIWLLESVLQSVAP